MKLFDEIPYLDNGYIILKKIRECDAGTIESMSANPNVRCRLPEFLFEFGYEDKREAVREMYKSLFTDKQSLMLGIYYASDPEKMLGMAELYNYNPNWNKVSIGCRIDEPYWGHKVGENTISLLIDYLFSKTDIKRVTAHVLVDNEYSCRACQREGFRLRKSNALEDWGYDKPVLINKYVREKWKGQSHVKVGNGPKPMIILPGLSLKSTLGGASSLEKNYKNFSEYTIYLFDDRDKIGEDYTLRERAGDVAAEMKTIGINNACVYGASMGGVVAQYLAIDHPDLVKKLYLTSTMARVNDTVAEVAARWADMAQKGELESLIKDMIGSIYSPDIVKKYGEVLADGMRDASQEDLEKFIILCRAVFNVNTYDELDKIKCPVFIDGALGDKVLTAEAGMEIRDKLKCGSYFYGEEYGHGVYDEAPDHRMKIYDFFEGI